jgi:lipoate-protein ligase B
VVLCAHFGLEGIPSQDGTGVFVDGKKVASIGVAIRHWINIHGIAINLAMDLEPFQKITPCGLAPEIMSDLSRLAGREIGLEEAKAAVPQALASLLAVPG